MFSVFVKLFFVNEHKTWIPLYSHIVATPPIYKQATQCFLPNLIWRIIFLCGNTSPTQKLKFESLHQISELYLFFVSHTKILNKKHLCSRSSAKLTENYDKMELRNHRFLSSYSPNRLNAKRGASWKRIFYKIAYISNFQSTIFVTV